MQVAFYARVSTSQPQQEGTIESQRRSLQQHIQHQGWALLPAHEYIDDGVSGARLDRPALDRLRDAARRGEFDAIVILSPDRLARSYAHQWLLIEEFEKMHIAVIFLHNPFGDSPQGKLLTQMQGMIAEYERAQITERTRRGRLEKARRGEFMPWAYRCHGYRYLPKRHGYAPQVVIEPAEAAVVRYAYRLLVEEQLSCRHITKRLNATNTCTPTGKSPVWQTATVRNMLGVSANRLYGFGRIIVQNLRRGSVDGRGALVADAATSDRVAFARPIVWLPGLRQGQERCAGHLAIVVKGDGMCTGRGIYLL